MRAPLSRGRSFRPIYASLCYFGPREGKNHFITFVLVRGWRVALFCFLYPPTNHQSKTSPDDVLKILKCLFPSLTLRDAPWNVWAFGYDVSVPALCEFDGKFDLGRDTLFSCNCHTYSLHA